MSDNGAPGAPATSARVAPGRPSRWADAEVVDCDVHLAVPPVERLEPFLDQRWRDYMRESGVRGLGSALYPAGSPLSARPGSTPASGGPPGSDLDLLRAHVLDHWRASYAVVSCGIEIAAIHNDDWAAAMARAVNDWQLAEWLDPEPRLRGSLVVPAAEPRAGGTRDRPARGPPRVRAGHAPRPGRGSARQAALLADLRGGRAARAGDRRPRRRCERQPGDAGGLADLPPRGLRRPRAGVPGPGREPRVGGRVREVPRPQGRADRGRVHLAAGADVAVRQELEGAAPRGPVGDPGSRPPSSGTASGSPPSPSTSPRTQTSWSRSSSSSAATTCCCSPPTTRTGSSTASRR